MKPMKLAAPCKDYIWGGTKLRTDYGQKCDAERVAESWMLSCHKDGSSVIATGEYAGVSLPDYIKQAGKEVLGTHCEKFEQFPVLVKLIDAKNRLSIQVHPDNDYAQRHEHEYGKTEMWYVVENEPGATLYYGFKEPIPKSEFEERIKNNTLLEVLNEVEVHPGDVYMIESGTLHAIGAGILVAEIQQNSNSTYRVYDYGRLGTDGKPRELHVQKALDVTKLEHPTRSARPQGEPEKVGDCTRTLLASCPYFTVHRVELNGKMDLNAGAESFHSILVLSGEGQLYQGGECMELTKGDSVFIPAGTGSYQISGSCDFLLTTE
ncbi:MAG: class I mannose-6-phosphate isomerase [Clostridiales bacterium]|nr:class I mannose-6-phosphate isomerase [Clostridiales bacterium]